MFVFIAEIICFSVDHMPGDYMKHNMKDNI